MTPKNSQLEPDAAVHLWTQKPLLDNVGVWPNESWIQAGIPNK